MVPGCATCAYVDATPSKPYRWASLEFLLRRATRRRFKKVTPVESHASNLVQLADVVLGALTSVADAPAKRVLRDALKASPTRKVRLERWSLASHAPHVVTRGDGGHSFGRAE
ncbi:MAG: DUF3800 domain-containing protein [bacterium]|nr:DUF3800 domain-containing protein [bacterium]